MGNNVLHLIVSLAPSSTAVLCNLYIYKIEDGARSLRQWKYTGPLSSLYHGQVLGALFKIYLWKWLKVSQTKCGKFHRPMTDRGSKILEYYINLYMGAHCHTLPWIAFLAAPVVIIFTHNAAGNREDKFYYYSKITQMFLGHLIRSLLEISFTSFPRMWENQF